MELYYLVGKNKTLVKATDTTDWARNYFHKHVGHSWIGGYRVSTVFIGIDSRSIFSSDPDVDKPVVFETMVFTRDGASLEKITHSSTWEEALKIHRLTCWEYIDMMSEED